MADSMLVPADSLFTEVDGAGNQPLGRRVNAMHTGIVYTSITKITPGQGYRAWLSILPIYLSISLVLNVSQFLPPAK